MNIQPFHLAIPVSDIKKSRKFYKEVLGCGEGKSSENWVDFNFFGHQLVIHYQEKEEKTTSSFNSSSDGKEVPIPHFGVVLEWDVFHEFLKLLKANEVNFTIEPYIRFEGQVGEQATMFFKDPSGNTLEFKSFRNMGQLFAS